MGAHGLLVDILLPALGKTLFSVPLRPSVEVAAVARTTFRQTAAQVEAEEAGPTNLLNKMLVWEHLVKATVVLQVSITIVVVVAVGQGLLVQYSMAATDLQVPSRECLLRTAVVVEQAAIQLLGTAAQVEAGTVLLIQMSLPAAERTSAVEAEVAGSQTHTQVSKLRVAVQVVAAL